MANRPEVEESGSNRKAREAYEHDCDDGVPDEGHIAPKCRYDVLPVNQSLTLPEELPHRTAHSISKESSGA